MVDTKRVEEIDRTISALRAEHASCTGRKAEVYDRICGYYRPVHDWNNGKRQEFAMRKTFDLPGG